MFPHRSAGGCGWLGSLSLCVRLVCVTTPCQGDTSDATMARKQASLRAAADYDTTAFRRDMTMPSVIKGRTLNDRVVNFGSSIDSNPTIVKGTKWDSSRREYVPVRSRPGSDQSRGGPSQSRSSSVLGPEGEEDDWRPPSSLYGSYGASIERPLRSVRESIVSNSSGSTVAEEENEGEGRRSVEVWRPFADDWVFSSSDWAHSCHTWRDENNNNLPVWATVTLLEYGQPVRDFDVSVREVVVSNDRTRATASHFPLGRIKSPGHDPKATAARKVLGDGLVFRREESGDVYLNSGCTAALASRDGLGHIPPGSVR